MIGDLDVGEKISCDLRRRCFMTVVFLWFAIVVVALAVVPTEVRQSIFSLDGGIDDKVEDEEDSLDSFNNNGRVLLKKDGTMLFWSIG